MREPACFIDGSWTVGDGVAISVVDPSSGDVIAAMAAASDGQVDCTVAAARRAFAEWRRSAASERRDWLHAVADEIETRSDELARMESIDTGIPLSLTAGGHLSRAVDCFRFFGSAIAQSSGEWFSLDDAYATLVQHRPLGVVGVLAPWNAPLAVAAMNCAAALAAGNCVILKPSERTPLSATLLAEIVESVGMPPGTFSLLQGAGEVGARLVRDPDVRGICFVGGAENGRQVLHAGAGKLKRILLEFGGFTPTIVFADAQFDAAIDGALLSAFSGNGEVCTAGARILVERSLCAEFTEALVARARAIRVGAPLDLATEMGPLIDEGHRARVDRLVADTARQGARVLCGGAVPKDMERGYFYAPTVIGDVGANMPLAREEVFGPVAALMPFDSEDEVVALAAHENFGLAATIWTGDVARAMRVAARLDCGGVAINAPFIRDIRAPFGGVGVSGMGRVGGRWSLEAYSEPKTLCLPISPYALPRLGSQMEKLP